ncbi:MAG: BrnA antitoxin family protein [Caulobacter sp.]
MRVEYDPLNPPPFTDEEKADLERLRTMRDEDIDFSDIPRATESFWRNAVQGMHYRVVKQQLTIRLDADVLDWLKSSGKGWQTKLNYHLRQAMERERGVKR